MKTLLLSMILYLAGIALVLFLRPATMFHEDGRWKEFSMDTGEGTLFPFWLFCVVWAAVSYFFVWLISAEDSVEPAANLATAAASAAALSSAPYTPTARVAAVPPESDDEAGLQPLPAPTKRNKNKKNVNAGTTGATAMNEMKPGYYKLNVEGSKRNGVPKYIYVGEDLPSESEED